MGGPVEPLARLWAWRNPASNSLGQGGGVEVMGGFQDAVGESLLILIVGVE